MRGVGAKNLRYSVKRHGYHGGASPQEVVVPLAVLRPLNAGIEGWSEADASAPPWRQRPEAPQIAVPPKPAPRPAQPLPISKKKGPLLPFPGTEVEPPSVPTEARPWVTALFASATYKAQAERNRRAPVEAERARKILETLDERGGRMPREALAARLGLQPVRLSGVLTVLRRILNVEGYAVLEVDEDSGSVVLNVELLRTQFDLQK